MGQFSFAYGKIVLTVLELIVFKHTETMLELQEEKITIKS
jgi:hypothetical protein